MVTGPTGAVFATKPVSSLPNATLTAVERFARFSFDYMTAGTGIYTPVNLLERWYPLTRQMGKAALKYKHLPITLGNLGLPQERWEVYHDVLAFIVTLASFEKLWQYNEYFTALDDLAWSRRRRAIHQLWREASAIFAPNALKTLSISDGQIWHLPPVIAPHLTSWISNSDAVTWPVTSYDEILDDVTHLDVLLQEIYGAIAWLGEGAGDEDDYAIRDIIDMLNDVPNGGGPVYPPGLPDLDSVAQLIVSPKAYEETYFRALSFAENVGGVDDEDWGFPAQDLAAEFGGRIPILHLGQPTPIDFSWFGTAKAVAAFHGATDTLAFIGGTIPQSLNTNPADPSGTIFRKNGTSVTPVDFGVATKLTAAEFLALLAEKGEIVNAQPYLQYNPWANLLYALASGGVITTANAKPIATRASFGSEIPTMSMVSLEEIDSFTIDLVAAMFAIPWSGITMGKAVGTVGPESYEPPPEGE
jgi:hypothetical protein